MSIQRDLNQGNIHKILSRLSKLERQAALAHSAIGREGLEVYDGGWIRILNGGLQVIGTATISGVLDVTGTFNASGTNNLSGVNHLTGPTDVAGNFEIIAGGQFKAGDSLIYPDGSAKFGALGIASDGTMQAGLFELRPDGSANFDTLEIMADGTLNVSNDVNVLSGGKIRAGNLEIEPANGGQINFTGGAIAVSETFGLGINHNVEVSLTAPAVRIPLASKPASELTPVGVDSNNYLYRIS